MVLGNWKEIIYAYRAEFLIVFKAWYQLHGRYGIEIRIYQTPVAAM